VTVTAEHYHNAENRNGRGIILAISKRKKQKKKYRENDVKGIK
jgi:hypothetical protein